MVQKPASIVSRAAVVLDHFLALFISAFIFLPLGILLLRNGSNFPFVTLLSVVITGLVTLAYFILLEYREGRTFFKKVFGMKVVSDSGELSLWQVVIRNFLRLIDISSFYLTGFGMILTNSNNKRLGDLAAGTKVVTEAENSDEEEPGIGLQIVGYSLAALGLFPMFGVIPAVLSAL